MTTPCLTLPLRKETEAEYRASRSETMLDIARRVVGVEAARCPFCGTEPPLATQNRFGQFQVGCEADECPVNPQCSDKALTGAWAKWNSRT